MKKKRKTLLWGIFDVDRATRKRWEFGLAVVRTLCNVGGFWLQLATLYYVLHR